jgi:hypothetical protein
MYSNKGLEIRLNKSLDIAEKEQGKSDLVYQVNTNNLTDLLENEIEVTNKATKLKEYKNKCERKRNFYQGKKWFKGRYQYWKQERIDCDKSDFNIKIKKVKYYRYDLDAMLSSTYKSGVQIETRGNLNKEVLGSFRTNVVTLIAFALLGALQVFIKDFSSEDLFVLIGRLLVFLMNIYSGITLGMGFVDNRYSNDLSKDYTYLKGFLAKHKVEGYTRP